MLQDLYKKWSAGNAIETDFMQDYAELGEFMEKLYDEMKISVDRDMKPYDAYFKIIKLNNFVNSIITKRPDIVDSLGQWFKKEKKDLDAIAKKMGALYLDIGISFPGGIILSLTFQPDL
ncbi:MAG: hypothetical protein RE471_07025 [Ferroplasma sp.]|uniref:hypothetical protein n=1 Tax=Ferroplasma sp. TaxID=2591003 RepID=UPI0028164016|nr:hypothetical protein [Ferroplasma sp.]WMT50726.1 MAG: hypothetical protein RE471_07025 [Ferroplasma sp.]